jgi:hypothetical protein
MLNKVIYVYMYESKGTMLKEFLKRLYQQEI